MKKLTISLAVLLVLALLSGCAADTSAMPVQTITEGSVPSVHVTTFTAEVRSVEPALMVRPVEENSGQTIQVAMAEGLVPVGADGWPISIFELSKGQQIDITYLGQDKPGDTDQVLAVAIRVIPDEDSADNTTYEPVTPSEPLEPDTDDLDDTHEQPPVAEPFTPIELPAQDAVTAQIPYDGVTLYGFPSVRTEIVRSAQADLDGCGTPELVQLLRIWDQYEQQSFVLRIQKGETVFDTGFLEGETSFPASFNAHIWLADLDTDGYPEVYFNGNMNDDLYVLNVWSMKSGTPELVALEDQSFMEAKVLSISNGSLQLESTQSVLGAYTAFRAYTLTDGVLMPLGDAWQIIPANTSFSRMTIVKEIPVTLDDGTDAVFPAGTVIQVTGTDGKSFVDVLTDDGVTGRIAVEQPAGDWQWYISGEPELEYFDLVPYAG